MRCPRCHGAVMPGLTECLGCGLDLSVAPEPARTMPPLGGPGRGLMEQRRRVRGSRARNAAARLQSQLDAWLHFESERLALRVPPFWCAWEGWCFGLFFLRRRQWLAGAGVALGLVLAMVLTMVDSRDRGQLSWSFWLLLGLLSTVGFAAVWQRLREIRMEDVPLRMIMGSITTVTALGLGYLMLRLVLGAAVPDDSLVRVNLDLNPGGRMVPAGSVALVLPVGSGELKRGDIVMRHHNLYRVLALGGENLAVHDCEIFIDGEAREGLAPLDRNWADTRCGAAIDRTTGDGHWSTLVRYYQERRYEWRTLEFPERPAEQRLALVIWPPGQWRTFP